MVKLFYQTRLPFFLSFLTLLLIGISSCNEDLPPVVDESNALLGSWSFFSASATKYSNGLWIEGLNSISASGTIEFRSSGWGTMNFEAIFDNQLLMRSQEFHWTSSALELLINQNEPSSGEVWSRNTNLSTLQSFTYIEAVNDSTNVVYLLNFSAQE